MTLALNKKLTKRAVVSLRASFKQQTNRDHEFDKHQQKSIVLQFIESKVWDLVKIFTDGGVLGFNVSANDRDDIQNIKKMADHREFYILVIYMSASLVRIVNETSLILSYLNQRDIRVFSYADGKISVKDHASKLKTYICYWQAEGESRNTSQRVSDAIVQAVTDEHYCGENTTYDYKFVNNRRNNYKEKAVLDIMTEGQKVILYQVVDSIDIYRDRVEIHVNIKIDMCENNLSDRLQAPTTEFMTVRTKSEDDDNLIIVACGVNTTILSRQSIIGGVNSVSLAG